MKNCKCEDLHDVGKYKLCFDCQSIYLDGKKVDEDGWVDLPLEDRNMLKEAMTTGKYTASMENILFRMNEHVERFKEDMQGCPYVKILKGLADFIIKSKLTKTEEELILISMASLSILYDASENMPILKKEFERFKRMVEGIER